MPLVASNNLKGKYLLGYLFLIDPLEDLKIDFDKVNILDY